MAAVAKGNVRPVEVPGYEVNDKGQAAVAFVRGDLLVMTAAAPGNGFERVWDKAPITATEADGIALMDARAGGIASVGIQGEMDGFLGLQAGLKLWPSATVAGGLDTTQPAGAVNRIKATTTARIRFSFV